MADSPPDEDMDTSPEPSKVPGGSKDLKDQDKSLEVEEEAVTLDYNPKELRYSNAQATARSTNRAARTTATRWESFTSPMKETKEKA
jgi:hypothetical protein